MKIKISSVSLLNDYLYLLPLYALPFFLTPHRKSLPHEGRCFGSLMAFGISLVSP